MNLKKYLILILAIVGTAVFVFTILKFFSKSENKIVIEQSAQKEIEKNESYEILQKNDSVEEKKDMFVLPKEKKDEEIEKKIERGELNKTEVEGSLVSFGYENAKNREVDTIVIHSTYNALVGDEYDVDKIIGIYKSYGVAAHYLIGRDGKILRLVDEKNVAYHAGVSEVPDGRSDVNKFSIGIELVANEKDGYTEKQYKSVSSLVRDIKNRYEIKYVLGHKDIAPGRKTDPWKFDFDKLN